MIRMPNRLSRIAVILTVACWTIVPRSTTVSAIPAVGGLPVCPAIGFGDEGNCVERLPNGIVVQKLKGKAANAYMDEAYAHNPRRAVAHAKGRQLLAAMGYRPTEMVFVIRVFRRLQSAHTNRMTLANLQIIPAQTYNFDYGSEDFTFYSHDDGDNSHWVGQFSYINNQTNDWGDWSGDHDDSSVDTAWQQVNWGYLNGDSGGNCCYEIRDELQRCASCGLRKVRFEHPDVWDGRGSPRPRLVEWLGNYRGFYGCAAAWCGGAAVAGYLFLGPAAPEFFAGGCTTALIGCSYGTLWQ